MGSLGGRQEVAREQVGAPEPQGPGGLGCGLRDEGHERRGLGLLEQLGLHLVGLGRGHPDGSGPAQYAGEPGVGELDGVDGVELVRPAQHLQVQRRRVRRDVVPARSGRRPLPPRPPRGAPRRRGSPPASGSSAPCATCLVVGAGMTAARTSAAGSGSISTYPGPDTRADPTTCSSHRRATMSPASSGAATLVRPATRSGRLVA